ncbi:type IV secretion system DNA-binding domain-containing protein [Candidatus Nomurabacteria bacterium]|nr:type IV secretion system DNA-binding domain-containing protein [Candidatus Nomurabacteria bacterium]
MNNPGQITYFAETDARNKRIAFGIRAEDRTKHVYVIGKTGMGKSTMLENMAVQDIRNGNGLCFIDPHGKTADLLLEYIPAERKDDVLYFAPFDMEFPVSFNVMEDVGYDKRHLVVSGLMSTFKKIWVDAWSARMEYILSNTLFALLEYPDSTLLSINKMFVDKEFRKKVVDNIKDATVKSFWVDEFAKFTDRYAAEATPAIQNKIGQFTSNPLVRNIIGQPRSSFDLRKLMDDRKIVIVNLSKGRIGETNANLLGSMLITKIYLAAMSRADLPESEVQKLPNFYLFVDEFQSFANESFADILSEARKYKLNLTMAHQYIEQMTEEVRAAVFGNVGTLISFRVGSYDAEVLEKEFAPRFTAQDMVNLGFAQIYLRLMIDGVGSQPFSARTLPPLEKPENNNIKQILDNSRRHFGKPRDIVEEEINVLLATEEKTQISPNSSQRDTSNKKRDDLPRQNDSRQNNRKQRRREDEKKPVIDSSKKNELLAALESQKKKIFESESSVPVEQESLSLNALRKPKEKRDAKSASTETRSELKNILNQVLASSENNKKDDLKSEVKKEEKTKDPKEIPEDELRALLEVAES